MHLFIERTLFFYSPIAVSVQSFTARQRAIFSADNSILLSMNVIYFRHAWSLRKEFAKSADYSFKSLEGSEKVPIFAPET